MPNEQWIMSVFKLSPWPDAARLVMGLRAIAIIGLVAIRTVSERSLWTGYLPAARLLVMHDWGPSVEIRSASVVSLPALSTAVTA